MSMPSVGTPEYEALLVETGGASANPGFNYEAHVAATGGSSSAGGSSGSSGAGASGSGASSSGGSSGQGSTGQDSSSSSDRSPTMPLPGTPEYEALLIETGGASANPGFNYEAHLAVTQGTSSGTGSGGANAGGAGSSTGSGSAGVTKGGAIAVDYVSSSGALILLQDPPATMPAVGSADYEMLMIETGGAAANPGFNYEAHIQATRGQPLSEIATQTSSSAASTGSSNQVKFVAPTVGSPEWQALLEETGGASALAGFNFDAHVRALQEMGLTSAAVNTSKVAAQSVSVFAGGESDVITSGKGNDFLVGGAGNDDLEGGGGQDNLFGGEGDDILNGGLGYDLLSGGEGSDQFVLDTKIKSATDLNVIADFESGIDEIVLSGTIFKSLLRVNDLNDAIVSGGLTPQDRNDCLLFDPITGTLYYDSDGVGKKVAVPILELPGIDNFDSTMVVIG